MELTAAVVGPAHGLRGEVVLDIRTDLPDRIAPGEQLRTTDARLPEVTVSAVRSQKGRVYARFDGVSTREEAESLRGVSLLVDEVPEDDAWYPHQVRGLPVRDTSGRSLGEVADLRTGAAQDLLVVRSSGRDVLVPFVRALVPVVDVEAGVVVVDPPEGLFEDAGDASAGDAR